MAGEADGSYLEVAGIQRVKSLPVAGEGQRHRLRHRNQARELAAGGLIHGATVPADGDRDLLALRIDRDRGERAAQRRDLDHRSGYRSARKTRYRLKPACGARIEDRERSISGPHDSVGKRGNARDCAGWRRSSNPAPRQSRHFPLSKNRCRNSGEEPPKRSPDCRADAGPNEAAPGKPITARRLRVGASKVKASTGPLKEVCWAGRQAAEMSPKTKSNAGRMKTSGVLRRWEVLGMMVTVEPDLGTAAGGEVYTNANAAAAPPMTAILNHRWDHKLSRLAFFCFLDNPRRRWSSRAWSRRSGCHSWHSRGPEKFQLARWPSNSRRPPDRLRWSGR